MIKTSYNRQYWEKRYQEGKTGWDAGEITPPLKSYADGLTHKDLKILIPGGGNSYEAEYLFRSGFHQVWVVDIAREPLQNLSDRCPGFPSAQLLQQDFFSLTPTFDLMLEQTFFCSFEPAHRPAYAEQCARLLRPGGRLAGVLFDCTFEQPGPPFGGNREEYRRYFEPYFDFLHWDSCYHSIAPRAGKELFMVLEKKI
jgi:SAM-dependent methyltransferase